MVIYLHTQAYIEDRVPFEGTTARPGKGSVLIVLGKNGVLNQEVEIEYY